MAIGLREGGIVVHSEQPTPRSHRALGQPDVRPGPRIWVALAGYKAVMAQKLNVADLKLSSPAFKHHSPIPSRHAGDGDDVAPALEWSGAPDGTEAFAVVV